MDLLCGFDVLAWGQEFECLLDVLKLTHSMLKERLPSLDGMEDIMAEVNESVSLMSFHNRISLHVRGCVSRSGSVAAVVI